MENEKNHKINFVYKLKNLITNSKNNSTLQQDNKKEKKLLQEEIPEIKNNEVNEKDSNFKKENNEKPVLKIVSQSDKKEENNLNDEVTESEEDVELIGERERKRQSNPKSKTSTSKSTDDEDDDDDTEDQYDTPEETDYDDSDELDKRKPYKRAKSVLKYIFRFGKALNAKPDEFADDDLTNAENQENYSNDKDENLREYNINYNYYLDDEHKKIKAPPPIEDIDMSFATVKKINGNIFIENNIEPMYTIETTKSSFNVEIGKLFPVILNAYEQYLEPEILKAKKEAEKAKKQAEVSDDEIITKATTVFNIGKNEKEKTKNSNIKIDNSIFDEKDDSVIVPEEYEIDDIDEQNKYKYSFLTKREKRKLLKKQSEKTNKSKKNKNKIFSGYNTTDDFNLLTSNQENYEKIDDYEIPQDAKAVMVEINMNIKRLFFRSIIVGILFVLSFIVDFLQRFFSPVIAQTIPNSDMLYCLLNLLFLSFGIGISFEAIKKGLSPLIYFKGSSDTAISVACVACVIQCILSFFDSNLFYNGKQNLYSLLVLFALTINSIGKLVMVLRIKDNFRFVLQDRKKYAATILNNKKSAEKMIRGTNAADPIIAYQRKTNFYKNFLKLSYSKDPSENMSAKFSIWTLVCSVVISVIHGILYKSIFGAFSSFAMMASLSIPVACMLSVNIPMKRLCRTALVNDAMIVGYPAVKQFADTCAIMLDSKELYPNTCVKLVSLKPLVPNETLEISLLNIAAVLKFANTSLTYVFSEVINKKDDDLPYVDSVKFEENKGIVGWIGGERVLIGRRELMKKYGVEGIEQMPKLDEKYLTKEHRNITYIANAGRLIAVMETSYSPDEKIKNELKKLQQNGVSILVRTADPTITSYLISRDYGLHKNSVRVLPNSLGAICKKSISEKSKRARCYIGTRGKFQSLAMAVSGCIKIKNNITISVIVQIIGIILGLLFSAVIALLSAEQGFGTLELLLFMVFWAAVSIVAPLILKT